MEMSRFAELKTGDMYLGKDGNHYYKFAGIKENIELYLDFCMFCANTGKAVHFSNVEIKY